MLSVINGYQVLEQMWYTVPEVAPRNVGLFTVL